MKAVLMPLLIASSALIGCQSQGVEPFDLQNDPLCSLQPITVNEPVREYLRMPIVAGEVPVDMIDSRGDIAAHNAKIRQHCDLERADRR